MFAVTVTLRLHPGRLDTFLPLVLENAKQSLATEPGCRQFDVCHDPDLPDTIFLYEIYDTPEAFADHLSTAHFKAFDAAVADMTRDKTAITFRHVHQ